MSAGMFAPRIIEPFAFLGLTGPFWHVYIDFVVGTWVAMGILLIITCFGQYFLSKEQSTFAMLYEKIIEMFMNLCSESVGTFNQAYFCFATSLFLFTFFCCFVGVIPFVEEATVNLNTTLAIALVSFCYVQYQKIRMHGIGGFLHEFIDPIFFMAPIHLVGELSKIASMAFRLFGNILGGSVIVGMVLEALSLQKEYLTPCIFGCIGLHLVLTYALQKKVPWVAGPHRFVSAFLNVFFIVAWVQIVLGVLDGLMQSFVLTMLTLTYLAMAMQHGEDKPSAQEGA